MTDRPSSGDRDHQGPIETVGWSGDAFTGVVRLIDQTLLPNEFMTISCGDVSSVWEAIKSLRVRGAPAIGVAAGYGVVVGGQSGLPGGRSGVADAARSASLSLRTSRPTAVTLFWALDRMEDRLAEVEHLEGDAILQVLLDEAQSIADEDKTMCRQIGAVGAAILGDNEGILTHCNAGGLATADYGTALAVIFSAQSAGKAPRVFADETRPLLQGARLTAWELQRAGVDVTLICDNMAAQVMKEGKIQRVIVGADRIAENGDTANKIGTYGVAVLAKAHGIPFYVAAPSSTFDLAIPDGSHIPIEQRDPREVTEGFGKRTAPEGVAVYNPAFDVTPASLITGIITERGLIAPVTVAAIRQLMTR